MENDLAKKLAVLNKQPTKPMPEEVKKLRQLMREDEMQHIRKDGIIEKKEANLTNIMHIKNQIRDAKA